MVQWQIQESYEAWMKSKASLSGVSLEFYRYFNFADVAEYLWEKRMESFIGCERSFIPIKLILLGYLVFALGNYAMKPYIEIGLIQLSS